MQAVYFTTNRLVLQLATPSLAGPVADFYARNAEYLREWDPERPEDFCAIQHQKRALRTAAKNARKGTNFQFWLRLRHGETAKPVVIGMIALNSVIYGNFCSAYLAYKLDEAHTHQGLMGEALQKIIQVAFGELGLHRLEANIIPRNAASLALVEKAGFQPEGMARKYLQINGVWEDHLHMALLNEPC